MNLNIYDSTFNILEARGFDDIIVKFFKSGFNGAIPNYVGYTLLIILSILISVLYSSFIGAQRERNGHPAGFRTHILISLGSSLLMVLSLYGADSSDQMRLAAAGVTGIGFLGAGSIIQNGFSVKGLTTAASIWVTMAIGMCCGAGCFTLATLALIICMISLNTFQKVKISTNGKSCFMLVVTEIDKQPIKKINEICNELNVELVDVDTSLVKSNGKNYLRLTLKLKSNRKGFALGTLEKINEVIEPIESKILH